MPEGFNDKQSRDKVGIIEAVLPKALFSVRLSEGRVIRAAMSSEARHRLVRLIAGDRVRVLVAAQDPNRGQITEKV